jgi:cytochrome c5
MPAGTCPKSGLVAPAPGPERSSLLSAQDRKFFDLFMVVLAILIGISVGIYVLSDKMSDATQSDYIREGGEYQEQISMRIEPVGQVRLPGEPGDEPVMQVAAAEPAPETLSGVQVYNQACVTCHGAGIAGSPVTGDVAAWAPRIAKGIDTLRQHAINGYQGEAGYMPAKGGNPSLSDEEVYRAIDYMLAESE